VSAPSDVAHGGGNTTFDRIRLIEAVATWRHKLNKTVITYGLARDTELSSYVVAATPVVAAKIGQHEFLLHS
jgi:hypothetical protein